MSFCSDFEILHLVKFSPFWADLVALGLRTGPLEHLLGVVHSLNLSKIDLESDLRKIAYFNSGLI